ncbi:MAG: HisA/HisF-related TIM barrel protein, partial [Stenotrophomonas maltophilia]
AVSRRFLRAGFAALHLVDLDAALGQGSNRRELLAVIEAADVPVQVGGGIRDRAAIDAWLAAGASRVIIGARFDFARTARDPGLFWLKQVWWVRKDQRIRCILVGVVLVGVGLPIHVHHQ